MNFELHAIVKGRVQLVMFRDYSRRKARVLGLVGTVHNLDDGTVEIFAQGGKKILDQYVTLLEHGSVLSRVDEIKTTFKKSVSTYNDFSILY